MPLTGKNAVIDGAADVDGIPVVWIGHRSHASTLSGQRSKIIHSPMTPREDLQRPGRSAAAGFYRALSDPAGAPEAPRPVSTARAADGEKRGSTGTSPRKRA
jgi:hypothetical protein